MTPDVERKSKMDLCVAGGTISSMAEVFCVSTSSLVKSSSAVTVRDVAIIPSSIGSTNSSIDLCHAVSVCVCIIEALRAAQTAFNQNRL